MLLAPALVLQKELARAEARFSELIKLVRGANDKLHLCAAYGNRMFLWSACKDDHAARDDLREAMRLARQVGHPGPERVATYNLAEDLYWSGEDDVEASELASQAWSLARRYVKAPVVEDALLVARTALPLGDQERAKDALQWARATLPWEQWSPSSQCFARMVEASLAETGVQEWDSLLQDASAVVGSDDLLEFRYWYLRQAVHKGLPEVSRLLQQAKEALADHPIWVQRFDEF